ncbi:MAG: 16S rRNA (adenine(1518)-N(6)/adenine(1519)-N(6))-dimethyltransferase RsmA [Syntrophales bacterium]|jgi:16S rRNA (adenine1518-N6/adenine1519-N6)-dimethyltransferase|nr:16S rRNA (adenine(1518)-N(6)/adenine(1519)-N(6))-dimethyltransferase RsmA [Syntrophales bacterium]MDY0045135.1 16S rRNA (adenine(1518)-N(6)/adenine(1519)-N(6))-dimethyltransferase RsmA [Syntrophales bacterium]
MAPTPKEILKKYGIRPLKRFGQSFLIDRRIIERIAASTDIGPDDTVIEIGAGAGIMTAVLAEQASRVIALEIDPRMIEVLTEELKFFDNVTILNTDVLDCDFKEMTKGKPARQVKLIGNIPYNISSQILLHLIEHRKALSTIVLMFQKEMADRIIAAPGTKEYGILSVLTAMYTQNTKVASVPADCFYPRPRVSSTVLKMKVLKQPAIMVDDPQMFQLLVRAAFSKRRKTLENSLKDNPFLRFEKKEVYSLAEVAGIDPIRRGETLTVEEFGKLANSLYRLRQIPS